MMMVGVGVLEGWLLGKVVVVLRAGGLGRVWWPFFGCFGGAKMVVRVM